MKKAAILGPRQAGIIDAREPVAKGDWVVVRVDVAPMCTEYKLFIEGKPLNYLGHEAAGTIVAVDQPGHVQVGDRVVVLPLYPCGKCWTCASGEYIHCENRINFGAYTNNGEGEATMAQFLVKPSWLCMKIPDDLPTERAALACCSLGPSFGALARINLAASDSILITGAGPVGLGAVANALHRNARVILVESVPWRAERAKEIGRRHNAEVTVLDPGDPDIVKKVRDLTGGRGVDCAVDCAGYVPAERLCLAATRKRGRVAFVGECFDEMPLRVSADLIRSGLEVHGIWMYNRNDFPKIMDVVRRSPAIDLLVSHTFPMSCIQEALETSASKQAAKILLKPWE